MTTLKLWWSQLVLIRRRYEATRLKSTKFPSSEPLVRLGQGDHTPYIEGKTNV